MAIVSEAGRTPWFLSTFASLLVGTIVITRAPNNRIGMMLFVFGSVAWLTPFPGYLVSADTAALAWADAIGNAVNTATLFLLGFMLIRFPDGELMSRRWRYLEWLGVVAATLGFFAALLNGGWGGDSAQALLPSPLRDATSPVSAILPSVFFPVLGLFFLLSVLAVSIRFRRSSGVERQQMKWLVYVSAVFVTVL
ncbi:MAG: hypothetical protein KDB69_02215, partial [Acidimicrobiia bacterium]|nr:hypothetical protein [Acidimicrobiia bacterium]